MRGEGWENGVEAGKRGTGRGELDSESRAAYSSYVHMHKKGGERMPRPRKCRRITGIAPHQAFWPDWPTDVALTLSREEIEVLRRVDADGEDQQSAAEAMGVSRGTVQRILAKAHRKVATALAYGVGLQFIGGDYEVMMGERDAVTFATNYIALQRQGGMKMSKIWAVMADGDHVSGHFGRSEGFYRVVMEEGKVKERQYIDARANQHEGMVSLMVQQGVQAVLAGGIGAHAVERLEAAGIRLLAGVRLPIDEAIQGLLAGTLEPGDTSCGCGGDHHGEGHHSHGHHHGEHHHQPQ